jgi:predicted metal-dependent hydrolase
MPSQLAFVFDHAAESARLDTLEPLQPQQLRVPPTPAFTLVFVRHPQARRYLLRVCVDGVVRVTLPRRGSRKEAAAFAERERPWIEKQLRRIIADDLRHALRPDVPNLARTLTALNGQALTEHELVERAKCELIPRLNELARVHHLTVKRVSIRSQRSRWGSCSPGGHICLNWRLVTMPDWVRDYVLIHELMHLKRMDHSPRFWKLVENACPDYRRARRYLRDHSPMVMPKAPAGIVTST